MLTQVALNFFFLSLLINFFNFILEFLIGLKLEFVIFFIFHGVIINPRPELRV